MENKNVTRPIKKTFSSITRFMQKAYWKIVTTKPSLFFMAALAIAGSIFLLGGGVYDILEAAAGKLLIAIVTSGGRFIAYYPYSLNEQFLVESIVIMALYAIGIVGFLLAYQSTKYAYRPRQAFMLLMVGCIFIVVAYVFSEYAFLARWRVSLS